MIHNTMGAEYSDRTERIQYLNANCDSVAETEYLKVFTPDALTALKDSLSETAIEIDRLEEEKKQVTAEINEMLKQRKTSQKATLKKLRDKAEHVSERCFVFLDETVRQAGIYNEEGRLVSTRPMKPAELQMGVFTRSETDAQPSYRTGTGD